MPGDESLVTCSLRREMQAECLQLKNILSHLIVVGSYRSKNVYNISDWNFKLHDNE